jgi:hypothetical protein
MSQQSPEETSQIRSPKKHGTGLKAWSYIMVIANVLAAIIYALATVLTVCNFSNLFDVSLVPVWTTVLFTILSIVNLVSAIALLKFRKGGFFVFIVSSVAFVVLDIWLEVTVLSSLPLLGIRTGNIMLAIGGVLGIGTLYWLVRSKWKMLQ